MPTIAVIGSSRTQSNDQDYLDAQRLGRLLAQAELTVASGGYGGLMEAVSEGAQSVGGAVIGVTAPDVFPGRARVNEYVTDEQPADTLTERIHQLIYHSDGVVALPGSIGTLTELMSAWNLAFVAPFSDRTPKPIIAVGSHWAGIVTYLTEQLETDGTLVTLANNVDDAARMIVEGVKDVVG